VRRPANVYQNMYMTTVSEACMWPSLLLRFVSNTAKTEDFQADKSSGLIYIQSGYDFPDTLSLHANTVISFGNPTS